MTESKQKKTRKKKKKRRMDERDNNFEVNCAWTENNSKEWMTQQLASEMHKKAKIPNPFGKCQ